MVAPFFFGMQFLIARNRVMVGSRSKWVADGSMVFSWNAIACLARLLMVDSRYQWITDPRQLRVARSCDAKGEVKRMYGLQ